MKTAMALYSVGDKIKYKKVELSLEHSYDGMRLSAQVDKIWYTVNLYDDSSVLSQGWWLGDYYLPPCEIECFLKDG